MKPLPMLFWIKCRYGGIHRCKSRHTDKKVALINRPTTPRKIKTPFAYDAVDYYLAAHPNRIYVNNNMHIIKHGADWLSWSPLWSDLSVCSQNNNFCRYVRKANSKRDNSFSEECDPFDRHHCHTLFYTLRVLSLKRLTDIALSWTYLYRREKASMITLILMCY